MGVEFVGGGWDKYDNPTEHNVHTLDVVEQ